MPGMLLHVGAVITCPDAGQASASPGNTRVMVDGQLVNTIADSYTVSGCSYVEKSSGVTAPCSSVTWTSPATRVLVSGQAPLLSTSSGTAIGVGGGSVTISSTQTRVTGT